MKRLVENLTFMFLFVTISLVLVVSMVGVTLLLNFVLGVETPYGAAISLVVILFIADKVKDRLFKK